MECRYYARRTQNVGPVSLAQLQQLAGTGQLRPSDMVLKEGAEKWAAAASPGLLTDEKGPASPPDCTFSAIGRQHQADSLRERHRGPHGRAMPIMLNGLWLWVAGAGTVCVVTLAITILLFNGSKEDSSTPGEPKTKKERQTFLLWPHYQVEFQRKHPSR